MRTAAAALVLKCVLVQATGLCGAEHQIGAHSSGYTDISGKLAITISDPFTIAGQSSDNLPVHAFPWLFNTSSGGIQLAYNAQGDVDGAWRATLKSTDQGKTWMPSSIGVNSCTAAGALRNGTVVAYDDYDFIKQRTSTAVTSVSQMTASTDGGRTFGPVQLASFDHPANVASRTLDAAAVAPYRSTSAQWSADITHALWGNVIERPDGTLLAAAHTLYQGDTKIRTVVYQSTNGGVTWGSETTVAYDPNMGSEGFTEPVLSFTSNGDVLCVMRTDGYTPLMQARSTDGGKTWSAPADTGALGVDPSLCLLSNGILACSYGRPGDAIMFSADGVGNQWTDRVQLHDDTSTTGYTGIAEVAPGKLLYVYDTYDRVGAGTIEGVFITVAKTPEPDALTLLFIGLVGLVCYAALRSPKHRKSAMLHHAIDGYPVGYTGLVETTPGKLLLVYDRHDVQNGRQVTTIQGVFITVAPVL
jgi:hypothetical protein